MSFIPGEDTEELRAVVRGFLGKHSPIAEVRRLIESRAGYDPEVWRQAARELALHGLAVPERFGGGGGTAVELGVVFEELGAALFCGPFFASVGLAATALTELGDEQAAVAHLPGIVSGGTVATLAWAGPSPAESTLTAVRDTGGWRLSGTAGIVIDGGSAGLVLAAARAEAGPSLFAVDRAGAGFTCRELTPMDSTRRLAELRFDGAPARLLGREGAAAGALRRAFDLAMLYLAAEQLGGAARSLASAVEHARTRVQFGRAIGSFQAVKHRCADLLMEVESAARPSTAGCGPPFTTRRTSRSPPRWPGRSPPTPISGPPPSRSTAASGSRGSTPRTSTSSAPRAASSCSGRPLPIAAGWRACSTWQGPALPPPGTHRRRPPRLPRGQS